MIRELIVDNYQKFTKTDNPFTDGAVFAQSMELNGDYIVVGTTTTDAYEGGAVILNSADGSLRNTISNTHSLATGSRAELFGYAVANNGTYSVVTLRTTTVTGGGGALLINNDTGVEVHEVSNPNPYGDDSDVYGKYTAINSTHFMISAEEEDEAVETRSGKVYVYSIATGALIWTLDNPNTTAGALGDRFGECIVANDNHIFVGATGEDSNGSSSSGAVHVFSATTGALVDTIEPNEPTINGSFGGVMTLNDDLLFVRNNITVGGVSYTGGVEVYNVSTFAYIDTLERPLEYGVAGADSGQTFATAMACDNRRLVVGTYASNYAVIYSLPTLSIAKIMYNPDENKSTYPDNFGASVGVNNDTLFIGAVSEQSDLGVTYNGSIYMFDIDFKMHASSETITETSTFKVPYGVSELTVLMAGGGGSGGAMATNLAVFAGGGYRGEIVEETIQVSFNEEIAVTIGAGGIGVSTSGTTEILVNGNSGSQTTFEASSGTITADGGNPGRCVGSLEYGGTYAERTTLLGTARDGGKIDIWSCGGQTSGYEDASHGGSDADSLDSGIASGSGGVKKTVLASATQYTSGDGGDGIVIVSWS